MKFFIEGQFCSLSFPGDSAVNKLPAMQEFDPWVRKILWEKKKWQPILVFLPGESHGQRSLAGSSLWGHKESDTTEWLSTHTHNVYTEEISLRVEFSIV